MTPGSTVLWYPIPMYVLNTLFISPKAVMCAANSASVIAGARSISSAERMVEGTV